MSNEKEWNWTDELVGEFAYWYKNSPRPIYDPLQDFKELKSKELYKPRRDYEIQCLVKDGKNYWVQKDGLYKSDLYDTHLTYQWFLAIGSTIHSVKRLSDNEVFTVGDKDVCWGRIVRFEIKELGFLFALCDDGHNKLIHVTIFDLQKEKERKPLFTTEDGKDIFEGDNAWFILHDDYEIRRLTCWSKHSEGTFKTCFSTEDKAKNYVIDNKKLFSVSEIIAISDWYLGMNEYEYRKFRIDELKNLAEQKINDTL